MTEAETDINKTTISCTYTHGHNRTYTYDHAHPAYIQTHVDTCSSHNLHTQCTLYTTHNALKVSITKDFTLQYCKFLQYNLCYHVLEPLSFQ